jgi:hypothetical protein
MLLALVLRGEPIMNLLMMVQYQLGFSILLEVLIVSF